MGTVILEKVPLLLLSAASAVITLECPASRGRRQVAFSVRVPPARGERQSLRMRAIWARRFGQRNWWQCTPIRPGFIPAGRSRQLFAAAAHYMSSAVGARATVLAAGWFWFLGSLVPMIGLVQVGEQALADRYAYISFIGLFVMVVWLIADMTGARHLPSRWLAVPAVACVATLAILTYRQVGYWHETESFWLRTIALTTDNSVAEGNLAAMLHAQGRDEEALAHL